MKRSSAVRKKTNYCNDSIDNFKKGFRSDCKVKRNKKKTKRNYQTPKSKKKKGDGDYYFSEKANKNALNNIKKHYELRKRIKVVNYRESSSDEDMFQNLESLCKVAKEKKPKNNKMSNNAQIMNFKRKKEEETIIHLSESEEENERSINPYKKGGKNNKYEARKKSLIQVHVQKEKIEDKNENFHSILGNCTKIYERRKKSILEREEKSLNNLFPVKKNKNEVLKNNKGDLQIVIKNEKINFSLNIIKKNSFLFISENYSPKYSAYLKIKMEIIFPNLS